MATTNPEVESLRNFVFESILNQDARTKSICILGKISSQPAIIVAEKTAFDATPTALASFCSPSYLSAVELMDRNDIYHWFLACTSSSPSSETIAANADAKMTLIFPATETHIKKYSAQHTRMVVETKEIYKDAVKPYVDSKREGSRLNWVYNILEHKAESERIVLEDESPTQGFILLPDLKWDRKTMASMYMMAVVHRRDISSLRDLKKKDVAWLKGMQNKIVAGICEKYPEVEDDQIKLYVHYQPSYYHFHIHAVNISHDGGLGQAAGKAFLLGNVISQLESMGGGEEAGFQDLELTFFLGEESELWQNVFAKLKQKKTE